MRELNETAAARVPSSTAQFLETCAWFHEMPTDRQAWVASRMSFRTLAAGEYLLADGQVSTHGYTLLSGLLVWAENNADGAEISMGALVSGAWFGHATLSAQTPRRGRIVALRTSTVACMPKDAFDWLMSNSIVFNNVIVRSLFARVEALMSNIGSRATKSIEQQVGLAILSLVDAGLHSVAMIKVFVSQEELGRVAGFSRQRCCAALRQLKTMRLVETCYGGLVIPSLSKLHDFVHGDTVPARM